MGEEMAKTVRRPMGEGEDLAYDLVERLKRNKSVEYIFQRDLDHVSAALQEERKYDDSRILNNLLADTKGVVASEKAETSEPLYTGYQ